MLRRLDLVRKDVLEERIASIIRVIVFLRIVLRLRVTVRVVLISPIIVTIMMEARRFSDTSVRTTTRHNNPENGILDVNLNIVMSLKVPVNPIGMENPGRR
jgi:hypothetical protein